MAAAGAGQAGGASADPAVQEQIAPEQRNPGELVRELVSRLPSDVLIRIFDELPRQELQGTVPAVCKWWQAVATEPSRLFRAVTLDLWRDKPLQPSLEAWLSARAGFLQRLTLRLPPEQAERAALAVTALAAASMPLQLNSLIVDFWLGASAAAAGLLAALASAPSICHRLEVLHVLAVQGELRIAHLDGSLQLPRLQSFKLAFKVPYTDPMTRFGEEDEEPNYLPEGFPSFLLACHKLESLSIVQAGPDSIPVLPEGLSQLQRLERLTLEGCGVEQLPASITAMTSLRSLQVTDDPPSATLRMPPSLAALAQLTEVFMSCVSAPLALGTLPGLKRLELHGLTPLEDMEAEFAQLLDGLRLVELCLISCRLETLPAAVTRQASLRSLHLRLCCLSELPPGAYLQQLQHLDVCGNFFAEVPRAALAEALPLQTLKMLDGNAPLQLAGRAGTVGLAAEVAAVDAWLQRQQALLAKSWRDEEAWPAE